MKERRIPPRVAAKIIFRLLLMSILPAAAFGRSGRIEQGQLTTDALRTNLFGDKATKSFKVYLPPSYDTSSNRYPVIYALHGYGQNEDALVTPSQLVTSAMQPALDSMIAQRIIGEMIVVFVNGDNRLNGSFYLDSPVIGNFETYITKDLVDLVDSRYRTLSSRESRGITGYSMGGWGAMHLALKFPMVFSVVVAEAGFYDSRSAWADGLTRQLLQVGSTNLAQFDSAPFPANAMQALFAGLLPNPLRPSLFTDYPCERVNGQFQVVEDANQRCLARDVQHGDLTSYLAQPVRLNGIKLVYGTADTVVPVSEPQNFTNALAASGIAFSCEEHAGDHVYRADLALPFLSSHLQGSQPYVSAPRLAIAELANTVRVTFPTQAGVAYKIESSSRLTDSGWLEESMIRGNGQTTNANFIRGDKPRFFRVVAFNTVP